MIKDDAGNILFAKQNTIFLKLAEEEFPRKLGMLDEENSVLIVHRDSSKHLFRKSDSYGFNDALLKSASKFTYVKLIVDKKHTYIIPVDCILTKGEYLNFKQQGFELQIFLSMDIIKLYEEELLKEEWKFEFDKCINNPYYFATTYLTINGKKFTTMLSEQEFNNKFKNLHNANTSRNIS